MSGEDAVPAAVPKRARSAMKRPDPIETKNRMKGKMMNLNKKAPRSSPSKVTTEKEQEVAEALFDLANLAGNEIETSTGTQQEKKGNNNRGKGARSDEGDNSKKGSKSKSKAFKALGNAGRPADGTRVADTNKSRAGKNDAGRAGMNPASVPLEAWPQGLPHPAFGQNLYAQMMGWQQANFSQGGQGAPLSGFSPQTAQNLVTPPVKSLKRCANHVYIAHLVQYHQRMQQASLMQTMGMNFTGGKPPLGNAGADPMTQPDGSNQQPQVQSSANAAGDSGALPGGGTKSNQDALKAQLMQQMPNAAAAASLSLLGYPPVLSMGGANGAVPGSEGLVMGPPTGLGAQNAANLPQQLANTMSAMQQQQTSSFPMIPPGQFPMGPVGQNATGGGMSPQQMAAFYAAAAPTLAFANAGSLVPNFVDPSIASAMSQQLGAMPQAQNNQQENSSTTLPPMTDQNAGVNNADSHPLAQFQAQNMLNAGGMQNLPAQLMASLHSSDPQVAAAAAAAAAQLLNQQSSKQPLPGNIGAFSMFPAGVDMKNAAASASAMNFTPGVFGANAMGPGGEAAMQFFNNLKAQEMATGAGMDANVRNAQTIAGQVGSSAPA
eukprot:CAMPEP_0198239562 /NCGR_PEP_ID=MMETSP1446-20131203/4931_1 /TAXON_ID=1461542 ORGANISM="Unidentified sp, Strain CCMP2111" /NCGR_SAMPLE_ID=MMETSP1446 /ASSEMBLY_ACC=CAM_ASM_001112 /LENGTH=603 /DNA_ID=CAMNT_0043922173 /DNA_START=319 /DNA_END=2130 /DNA_ORIENTATION=+